MDSMKRKRESSPSPSSSSTSQPKYDVFLSFRGEDTRANFTDHLYVELKRKGIITFRDEEELKKGERISNLFKAIEESEFAVIILSRNYASSTWCLDELAKIMKCKDEIGLKVLPVFYDVSPSIVRKQTEPFEQAFIDHQKRFEDNIKNVETWRTALREVADISGWHLQNRKESEIIQDIVKEIMKKLSSKSSSFNKNLIGIKSMVAELIPSYLGFGNDIYMMGIWGMGGLGKTTLASAIYQEYSDHFEGSSFIANVRERSEKDKLHKSQMQLLNETLGGSNTTIYNVQAGVKKIKSSGLRHKKVLLVLDDVNHKDQLENLVGEKNWFGSGSWIIITTRDEHVLVEHEVLKRYKPELLYNDDASKLFCLKAFKMEQPKEKYVQLSQKFVTRANGLPLALVTLGSFLAGRTIDEWQSALNNFKEQKVKIFDILKISYDGLKEEMWKEIFLDIACFFLWWKKEQVIEILKNFDIDARIVISVLVEKSLLTIDDRECLRMHDLLQEMGKKIALKSGENHGKQSRLWLNKDLLDVLEKNMAIEAIQAIVVKGWREDFNLEEFSEGFSKMSNLRLLIIYRMGSLNDQRHLALPNNLRYLRWRDCPFKCLASSHKQQMAFVHLDLQYSKFEYLWEGVMRSETLKFIDLSYSKSLIRTPDFSGVPILEELRLSYCDQLVEIHPSIGQLKNLRYLYLYWCASLTNLPCMSAEKMQSLMVLDLSRCYKISFIPKFTGIMKSLSTLNLAFTAIKEVDPSSIEYLPALTFLDLSHCTRLECLPSNMDNLKSLEIVKLSQCSELKSLPRLPSNVRCIEAKGFSFLNGSPEGVELSIWSQPLSQWPPFDESSSLVGFTKLFHFLRRLVNLKFIDLSDSKSLIWTPDFSAVPILEELRLSYCRQLVEIHPSIVQLKNLRYLDLSWCTSLTNLPSMSAEMMQSLTVLDLSFCVKISLFPKFTGIMESLSELNLSETAIENVEPSSIEGLTALASFDLGHCTRLECLPSNMDNLRSLERLNLSHCWKLKSLPRLPSNVKVDLPEGFSFLNWSPEGVKLSIWSQPLSQWLPFDESGSLVGFTKLFHFLRGLLFHKAVLGGYIIRSCSAEKEGFSINIELPSNWYNNKWIGFALWASLPRLPRDVEVKDGIRARVIAPGDMLWNHRDSVHSTTCVNGICLLYLSREDWLGAVGNNECRQITVKFKNKNSICSIFENHNSRYSTVQIRGECGVSLIYKQGVVCVDELNEINAPWFIESFGEVSIYKLTGGDDDVHIVDDDGVRIVDDDVHKFRDDVHKFGDDDFDDADIK